MPITTSSSQLSSGSGAFMGTIYTGIAIEQRTTPFGEMDIIKTIET